jgi:hypothetical protein
MAFVSEEDLALLDSRTTIDVTTAARIAHVGRSTMFKAVHAGQVRSVRLGNRLLIPTVPFRRQLGLDDGEETQEMTVCANSADEAR